MARHLRLGPKSVPQHVIQRGNNRKICFGSENDYAAYIHWLKKYSVKYSVSIHAWVLMTNHVHILCTPTQDNKGVSLMMQSLGREYVLYFNNTYNRTGTLWEGRFKSCLVCAPDYLLNLYQYIELNPVRANMVADPADYKWSSYQINALDKRSSLCRPHDLYTALGSDDKKRKSAYRDLFADILSHGLIDNIRKCSNKELVLGSEKFISEIKDLVGFTLKSNKRGRPRSNKCT